jgi:hypothetical protein
VIVGSCEDLAVGLGVMVPIGLIARTKTLSEIVSHAGNFDDTELTPAIRSSMAALSPSSFNNLCPSPVLSPVAPSPFLALSSSLTSPRRALRPPSADKSSPLCTRSYSSFHRSHLCFTPSSSSTTDSYFWISSSRSIRSDSSADSRVALRGKFVNVGAEVDVGKRRDRRFCKEGRRDSS